MAWLIALAVVTVGWYVLKLCVHISNKRYESELVPIKVSATTYDFETYKRIR